MSGGGGRILAGIFLILCGLCVAFVGGACTFVMLPDLIKDISHGNQVNIMLEVPSVLVSIGTTVIGVTLVVFGVRSVDSVPSRRGRAADPASAETDDEGWADHNRGEAP